MSKLSTALEVATAVGLAGFGLATFCSGTAHRAEIAQRCVDEIDYQITIHRNNPTDSFPEKGELVTEAGRYFTQEVYDAATGKYYKAICEETGKEFDPVRVTWQDLGTLPPSARR